MLKMLRKHSGKEFVYTFEMKVLWPLNFLPMEKDFIPAEKELALEAWMLQTFRLDDKLLGKGFVVTAWLRAEIQWFELN